MKITNNADISLPLAVWLIHDEYDYINLPNYISVTTLMRPVKQIVLPGRIPPEQRTADVEDYVARALGQSIHTAIEKAWTDGYARSLRLLGYPDDVIARVAVNPTDEELQARSDIIPVYLEQRTMREFEGFTIGGKFDMVTDGIVNDTKSTSAWGWVFGTRDDENKLQGSLYRWLDVTRPGIKRITEDFMRVNYVFTDWQKSQARTNPKYPKKRVEYKDIPLMSLKETEEWVRFKLNLLKQHSQSEEEHMPACSDEELWRSDPKYKYFTDPAKAAQPGARSTRNFDTLSEASAYKAQQGKGVVVTIPGEVKACGYCPAYDNCKQKDQYFNV